MFERKSVKMEEKVRNKFSEKQKRFLKALEETGGNITAACMKSGIKSRNTVYKWMKHDSFKAEVDSINEAAIDYVESKLMSAIQQDNVTAIIFYLKTKGKKRGYVETIDNQISVNPFEELMKALPDEDVEK